MLLRIRALVSLGIAAALATPAGAQNGFKAFGPPNEWGYPAWYSDHQDLALEHCVDQNDPLCGIAEPLVLPLVISDDPAEGNFYHETFYWWGNSTMNIPNRGEALLVLALEGVFGNATEAVLDGDQTVFSRLRIRLRGDGFEGGFYRIFTPYGIYEFDAPPVEPGDRIINHTVDCLHVFLPNPPPSTICGQVPDGPGANFFTTPLGILDDGTPAPQFAPNGPNFLIWDPTVAPLAPAGYVGDPRILHPVIGAVAPNENVFRVQYRATQGGPVVFDVQTDLFSILGKIATVADPCASQPPVANFGASPLSGPAPLQVTFTDLSTCATAWQWNFGDGGMSNEQSPVHVYDTPGVYSVSLMVEGLGGADTELRNALVTVTGDDPDPTGLVLAQPVPGTAGVQNSWVVTGCTPGRQVGVYSGLVLGNSILNLGSCGGIPMNLARPFRLVARAAANGAGVATILATPPLGTAGKIFRFQAVEPFSCRTSNVVSEQL